MTSESAAGRDETQGDGETRCALGAGELGNPFDTQRPFPAPTLWPPPPFPRVIDFQFMKMIGEGAK